MVDPASEARGFLLRGCGKCHGTGRIPAPLIDPRWRSADVLGLAETILGREAVWYCRNCGGGNWTADFWCYCGDKASRIKSEVQPPLFDRLPILADALMDAGCHDEELIAYCQNNGRVK